MEIYLFCADNDRFNFDMEVLLHIQGVAQRSPGYSNLQKLVWGYIFSVLCTKRDIFKHREYYEVYFVYKHFSETLENSVTKTVLLVDQSKALALAVVFNQRVFYRP